MKQHIQKIWMVIAMLCLSISATAYDFEVDGIYYNLNTSAKTATVTYKTEGKPSYEGDIVIPAVVKYLGEEIPISSIGYRALSNCTAVTSILLPETIIYISNCAFEKCSNLEFAKLPDSIEGIGESAFRDCSSLRYINIPEKVQILEPYVFSGCSSLESIVLSNEFEVIPAGLFSGCKSLKTIGLPKKLKKIEDGAFAGCKSLESVCFNEILEYIGNAAFSSCQGLKYLIIPDTVSYIGSSAFQYCVNLTEITLPKEIRTIASQLFKGCESLASLIIPCNVETIEFEAFSGCKSLLELSIPPSVKQIARNGMNGTYFKTFIFEDSPSPISIPNYISEEMRDGYVLSYDGNCKFPSTLISLYVGRDIDINNGLRKGRKENDPFYDCSNLKVISVGPRVTDLTALNTNRYDVLDSLRLMGCVPPAINSFTPDQYLTVKICVPNQAIETYQQADVWKNFWNIEGFDISAETISLNIQDAKLYIGETVQLGVKIYPEKATDMVLEWRSSNEDVAIVDEFGLVTAMNTGTAIIRVAGKAYPAVYAECSVTVMPIAATSIYLRTIEWTGGVGEEFTIRATVHPKNATDKTLEWRSSNEDVAIVDDSGHVTAIGEGSATIMVTCGNASAQCSVKVLKENGVESIFANPNSSFSICTAEGIIIKNGANVEDLKTLAKGIYIIVSGESRYKISI